MKKLLIFVPLLLFSCKKDEPQPQPTGCNCYKAYEMVVQGQWTPQYDTAEEIQECSVDGSLIYEAANKRYTWVCQ